jgi:putative glutamine amidotransferase
MHSFMLRQMTQDETTRRPLIGLTLDSEEAGGYSKFPWFALRQNYMSAVARAGGLPLALSHDVGLVESYLDLIDGLIVTGGAFDVDPALFGDHEQHDSVILKPARTDFEMAVTRAALARDMPVLGICGGQQLLHVALEGRLIQHIPEAVTDALAHEQPNPRDEAGHTVAITPGTRLHGIVETSEMNVNSAHHQAALDAPDGVVINARAADGVIEGIEAPAYGFCLGVQWHPESEIDAGDGRIFQALIAAARA